MAVHVNVDRPSPAGPTSTSMFPGRINVEVATAVVMGAPALVKEGVSWKEIRLRALHTTPVELSHRPTTARAGVRS